jgi:hypothetical protein
VSNDRYKPFRNPKEFFRYVAYKSLWLSGKTHTEIAQELRADVLSVASSISKYRKLFGVDEWPYRDTYIEKCQALGVPVGTHLKDLKSSGEPQGERVMFRG